MDIAAEYLELFLAFSAVVGVVYGLIRRGQKALEHKISTQIRESTEQIRKNANGGQSLKDLHDKVDCLVENQQAIKADVETLRASVVQLENDAEGI